MLWKLTPKLSAAESRLIARMRARSRFYIFLRNIRSELFDDEFQEELASAYQPRGQEPVPPALLAMVTLLQAYTETGDAAAVEEAELNPRWQLVLGTLGSEQAPFGQGSLVRFRARMAKHDLDKRLIDRTVELAKSSGLFGWQKLRAALDSSPLRGHGRVEDTWNLIGRAMSKLVAIMTRVVGVPEEQIVEEAGLSLLEGPSLKATLDIDWDNDRQRVDALQVVLEQAHTLLTWISEQAQEEHEQPEVQNAVALLERIIEQDTEPDPDRPSRRRIVRGTAPDRVCSVGDIEMRHGRKNKTKAFNGYKRHIAALVDAPLILAATARPANQPESEAASELLGDVAAHGPVVELFIDRGYISSPAVIALHRQRVPVRCKAWPTPNITGRWTKERFRIDLRRRVVTCPANRRARISRRDNVARFEPEGCSACRFREKCTSSKAGRTVAVHEDEALLKKLRGRQQTRVGRQQLRTRVVVEHRLARVQHLQGGCARYVGERRNTLDLRRHAAVANLLELQAAARAA